MTLEEATAVLNDRCHHGHSGWYLSGGFNQVDGKQRDDRVVYGIDQYEIFEPFEAIAIAEKYVREKLATEG